jgi:hypothetical protein
MDFTSISPMLLMDWNRFFYYTTIISIFLAIILFGLPYVSIKSIPFRPKFLKEVDQVRLQKFFGRITGYLFIGLVVVLLTFVFSSVYSIVIGIQLALANTKDIAQINGLWAWIIATLFSSIFVFFAARWLRKQWNESASDTLPHTESVQLREVINRLNSKLEKLDKLDKIDKLVNTLEKRETKDKNKR